MTHLTPVWTWGNNRDIYGALIIGDFDETNNLNSLDVYYDKDLYRAVSSIFWRTKRL